MKERPILFSGQMIKAILGGRKTQTRRVMKPQPEWVTPDGVMNWNKSCAMVSAHKCPYGFPGCHVWVREKHARYEHGGICTPHYLADGQMPTIDDRHDAGLLKVYPSIHMPRWASRITLEVTGVRVERLQDIGQGSACAEGCPPLNEPIEWFHGLWDTINGKSYPWESNPYVWVIEFKRIEVSK